jgi:hypothetical protein
MWCNQDNWLDGLVFFQEGFHDNTLEMEDRWQE